MVAVYVALVIAGRRKFSDCPITIKEQVRAELIALGLEHLIDE